MCPRLRRAIRHWIRALLSGLPCAKHLLFTVPPWPPSCLCLALVSHRPSAHLTHYTHHIESRARHLENLPMLRIRTGSRHSRALGCALEDWWLSGDRPEGPSALVSMQRFGPRWSPEEGGGASKDAKDSIPCGRQGILHHRPLAMAKCDGLPPAFVFRHRDPGNHPCRAFLKATCIRPKRLAMLGH